MAVYIVAGLVFMLLFLLLLDGICHISALHRHLPTSFSRSDWFAALTNIAPTTVIASITFYITKASDKREEERRTHYHRPHFVGTASEIRIIDEVEIDELELARMSQVKKEDSLDACLFINLCMKDRNQADGFTVLEGKLWKVKIEVKDINSDIRVDIDFPQAVVLFTDIYPDDKTDIQFKIADYLNMQTYRELAAYIGPVRKKRGHKKAVVAIKLEINGKNYEQKDTFYEVTYRAELAPEAGKDTFKAVRQAIEAKEKEQQEEEPKNGKGKGTAEGKDH